MAGSLFDFDRDVGRRHVCGADEVGRACWAGPLVVAAVRIDYDELDAVAETRLADLRLGDSKKLSARQRAALLPVILEVADVATIVGVSVDEIDRDGLQKANVRALARALEAVAVVGSINLVDWYALEGVELPHEPVEGGHRTSAAIAAASIVAKETRDQLMRQLDVEHPGYGFAAHKGYGTPVHETAVVELGLSPVHRRSVHIKAYARHVSSRVPDPPKDLSSSPSAADRLRVLTALRDDGVITEEEVAAKRAPLMDVL